jgi:hypothetical protein
MIRFLAYFNYFYLFYKIFTIIVLCIHIEPQNCSNSLSVGSQNEDKEMIDIMYDIIISRG